MPVFIPFQIVSSLQSSVFILHPDGSCTASWATSLFPCLEEGGEEGRERWGRGGAGGLRGTSQLDLFQKVPPLPELLVETCPSPRMGEPGLPWLMTRCLPRSQTVATPHPHPQRGAPPANRIVGLDLRESSGCFSGLTLATHSSLVPLKAAVVWFSSHWTWLACLLPPLSDLPGSFYAYFRERKRDHSTGPPATMLLWCCPWCPRVLPGA